MAGSLLFLIVERSGRAIAARGRTTRTSAMRGSPTWSRADGQPGTAGADAARARGHDARGLRLVPWQYRRGTRDSPDAYEARGHYRGDGPALDDFFQTTDAEVKELLERAAADHVSVRLGRPCRDRDRVRRNA